MTHRPIAAIYAAFLAVASPALVAGGMSGKPSCQILDRQTRPLYGATLGFLPEVQFGPYGDSAAMELDAYWDIAYYRDLNYFGDLSLSLSAENKFLTDSAGVDLPKGLTALALDASCTWRYEGGTALRVGLSPGIYSEMSGLDGDALDVPFSVGLIQSFVPSLSGRVGMQIRPQFLTKFMPEAGLEWQPLDLLRFSAMLPESRATWYVHPDWTTYVGFEWQNMSYAMSTHGGVDRKQVEIEDYRGFWGLTCRLSDALQLSGEIGRVFGRSLEFRSDAPGLDRSLDVESSLFVRFAVGGPF